MNVQITDSISSGDHLPRGVGSENASRRSGSDARKQFRRLMATLYPNGMKDKRLLDCGCGAGGYCFWAGELKAELAYGFDVREHWIKQARFLRYNRKISNIGINKRLKFNTLNLYDLPTENNFPFDIVLFKNLFFHLEDPVGGLRIAADLSRDVLVFSSAVIWGQPDGSLRMAKCDEPKLHGGVSNLNWYPTGPGVCAEIIRNLGFEELVLTKCRQVAARPDYGRIEIIASRRKNRLGDLRGEIL